MAAHARRGTTRPDEAPGSGPHAALPGTAGRGRPLHAAACVVPPPAASLSPASTSQATLSTIDVDHIRIPARCWSASGAGPNGRATWA